MENKGKVCRLSLDVAGAFDSVWRQSVLHQLTIAQCPLNIFSLVRDYFSDRTVEFSHNGQNCSFPAERGVPQGSCSGPFFWNIVLDTALDEKLPEGCFLQSFPDVLILVVRGHTKEDLEERGTLALL
ncbi:hypothetical protein AVEN_197313-1 [Araneus ventricosus]|uniref:Reverse transcriptase domain-containing protein n=1 Tax=Araneus ventricosus TaxID=182803 RepID=A0A4Y2EWE5_ARAVE|nr:hypothetical protein AVEN_197313-1 [Araneus ventricosus]